MGFLDFLKGGRPDVTVLAEPADALPGDEVRVRVTVAGQIDDKAQSARAGIRCINDYLTREYDHQDDEWEEVWRALSLHQDAQDLPLQAGEHDFVFRIPEGLPPTSDKAVSWWAWAQIDRRRGLDATGSTRIAVRFPAAAAPSGSRSIPPDNEGIGFEDIASSAGPGQTIDGVLTVTPHDDVEATAVKVKLTRRRTYTDGSRRLERKDDIGEVEIASEQELAAGQTQQFPFSLTVPREPGPTATAPHSVVEWFVTGIVARRMKDDLEAHAAVVVHDGA